MKRRTRGPDVNKAALSAIWVNSLQIVMILGLVIYLFVVPASAQRTWLVRILIVVAAGVVISGAVLDIREAVSTRRLNVQLGAMEESMDTLDQLNLKLRAQRHDFLNHLQVVYSLIEMEEYQEANAYIEKVYGEITSLSRTLKTSIPAVNALLQVKLAACERESIHAELEIHSAWEDLPMESWEMCKVLGNLIDNAVDALREQPEENRRLLIALGEEPTRYTLRVSNPAPAMTEEQLQSLFTPGVTTKSEGHGMGLYIVQNILRDVGGDISASWADGDITFSAWVPKPAPAEAVENL